MDKFGFSQAAAQMQRVEQSFIRQGIELAREEMIENIESQSSKESGSPYPELSYRTTPPPRLILTGALFDEIKENQPVIIGNKGVLTIDPTDEHGDGYASYHQDGENQYRDKEDFQAEFVTQSGELEGKQVGLLINELDKIFR